MHSEEEYHVLRWIGRPSSVYYVPEVAAANGCNPVKCRKSIWRCMLGLVVIALANGR